MDYTGIIIPFVGGLGMFIYGMQIMAQGLENAAGNKMKSLLEVLTKNKFFGVLLGAFITAVIQSSSATTVMVVGFVNAGIMNLTQAMGVIMGANIGTTIVTAVIQSSSASVGILQSLAAAGLVPMSAAVYIIMGQNIGTCVTAMLSSVGAKRNAKTAALMHLLFNVIGTVIFSIVAIIFFTVMNPALGENLITQTEISTVRRATR